MKVISLPVTRSGSPVTVEVYGVAPSRSGETVSEESREGHPVVEVAEVFGPASMDLRQGDVVTWDGVAWAVEGEAATYTNPTSGRSGSVARMRRSTPGHRSSRPRRV